MACGERRVARCVSYGVALGYGGYGLRRSGTDLAQGKRSCQSNFFSPGLGCFDTAAAMADAPHANANFSLCCLHMTQAIQGVLRGQE